MMYRQSVVQFDKDKYTKTTSDVLEKVFSLEHKRVSHNGKMYVCKTYKVEKAQSCSLLIHVHRYTL